MRKINCCKGTRMKRMMIFLCLIYVSTGAFSQIPEKPQSMSSPNVASLGLYGEIPVSPYTGVPDISIPLYEIPVGEHTLPISLSYHASGVRPDQHPGWVGLGWSLNGGGSISRIVKGKPDDCNIPNFTGFISAGYYFNTGLLNTSDWNTPSRLESSAITYDNKDLEPDEFHFDFLDYHGKFMLGSDKKWIVQCNKPVKVEFDGTWMPVPFDKSGTAFQYSGYSPSFNGFTLTTEDGTRYVFGKDKNAVEYSIGFFQQATDVWVATAWQLTKITYPNDMEVTYSYDRGDFINQMYISINDDLGSFSWGDGFLNPECGSSSHTTLAASYQGNLISPVYLNKITFPEGYIEVLRAATRELKYSQDTYSFRYSQYQHNPSYRFLRFLAKDLLNDDYPNCLEKLKWNRLMQLNMKDKKGNSIKSYLFTHSSDSNQRLTLNSILEMKNFAIRGKLYSLEYDSSHLLPPYLSGKTDHWGFFNNRVMTDDFANHYASREPDARVLTYGMLNKIVYPTGGYHRFVFEPHDYSRQVKMNRWEGCEAAFPKRTAGGVRIKKMIVSPTGNAADETVDKEFFYVNDYPANQAQAATSSGVLGGQLRYYFDDYQVHGYGSNKDMQRVNKYFSSQSVLPACINSSGCHIGYTEVTEKRNDGSFICRKYANFDNGYPDEAPEAVMYVNRTPYMPYNSKAMERGQLLSESMYAAGGRLAARQTFTYELSSGQYTRAMRTMLKRFCPNSTMTYADGCAYKNYMYISRLKSVSEAVYDNSSYPVNTQTTYIYNPDGLVKEILTTVNGGTRRKIYLRPGDYSEGSILLMRNAHVLSPIILECDFFIPTTGINELLKCRSYTYLKLGDALFCQSEIHETIGSGPEREVWRCLDFATYARPLVIREKGEEIVYCWGYNSLYLVAEIRGTTFKEVEAAFGGAQELNDFMKADTPDYSKLDLVKKISPEVQVTSYKHQPLVGVTAVTEPNGATTYYEYDNFNRLRIKRNCDNEIEKIYDYQYAVKFGL